MRLWTAMFMRAFPTDMLEIRDYDPAWPEFFAKLAARARTALGSLVLTVEHIGSTSVPGLAAKPIIDFDVVLASPGRTNCAAIWLSAMHCAQISIYETATVRSSD